jgi:hypothetical protein
MNRVLGWNPLKRYYNIGNQQCTGWEPPKMLFAKTFKKCQKVADKVDFIPGSQNIQDLF